LWALGALIHGRCLKPSFFCHSRQPSESFFWRFALYGAGKMLSPLVQDTPVRGGIQEGFHQHRAPMSLWFFTYRHALENSFHS